MNGLILILLALPMAVLAIDGEKPGFVNDVIDAVRKGETDD